MVNDVCVTWRKPLEHVSPPVMLVVWTFAAVTLLVALFVPFPSTYDELQHLSVIRVQFEHPSLFADPSKYLVLRRDDPTRWSATGNYVNHPAFYYLAMSAYLHVTDNVLAARLINVVLAVATLVLILWAGLPRFATRFGQAAFAVIAASFPKAALIGGMVNNDNLAGLAGAIVFGGMVRGSAWLLGLGLALAGWTKLTALIALGTVVAVERAWRIIRGDRWVSRDTAWIVAGAAIGTLPFAVNLIETGHLLYVNEAVYRVAPGDRPVADVLTFASFFFGTLAMKWGAVEFALPLWAAAALLAVPLALAGLGIARERTIARACLPYAAGIGVTLIIHFWFGWSAFERLGDQTIAQTRYYNVLWPGVALAAAAGLVAVYRSSRSLGIATLLLCVAPTMVGGVLLTLFVQRF